MSRPLISFILDLLEQLVSFCLASILHFFCRHVIQKRSRVLFSVCLSLCVGKTFFRAVTLPPIFLSFSLSFFFFSCLHSSPPLSLSFLLEGGRTSAKFFLSIRSRGLKALFHFKLPRHRNGKLSRAIRAAQYEERRVRQREERVAEQRRKEAAQQAVRQQRIQEAERIYNQILAIELNTSKRVTTTFSKFKKIIQ